MNGSDPTPSALAELGSGLPFLAVVLALFDLGGPTTLPAFGVSVVAIALSFALRRWGTASLGALWIVPAGVSAGLGVALSGSSLTTESLSALAGIALLFWIGASTPSRPSVVRTSAALLLPGTSVVLALLVTQVLPGGAERLGVASALLVVVLLAFGWAIRSDRSSDGAAGS